jgi:hypothetical protein
MRLDKLSDLDRYAIVYSSIMNECGCELYGDDLFYATLVILDCRAHVLECSKAHNRSDY